MAKVKVTMENGGVYTIELYPEFAPATVAFLVIIAPIAEAANNASIISSSLNPYSLPIVTIAPGNIPQQ